MKSSSKTYLYALDHLRALAALLVLFWHAVHQRGIEAGYVPSNLFASFFEEGHSGVALFICISGFVFTVLTHEYEIAYFPFLKNRIIRLFPLIFLFSLFAVSSEGTPKDSILQFASLLGGGVVYGTWTLAIEFQFYVSFPFIRKIFWRTQPALIAISFLGILALFFFFRLAFYLKHGNAQEVAYWTIFGRADQFLWGMFAGVCYLSLRTWNSRWRNPILWPALIVMALLTAGYYDWFNGKGGFWNYGGYPSPSLIWLVMPSIEGVLWSAIIVIYCLIGVSWRGPLVRSVSYLGAVSYSTYMIHYLTLPTITALLERGSEIHVFADKFANESFIVLAIYYPLTIAISAISYETIERPFLQSRVDYRIPAAKKSAT